jgi:hypothetical protein
MLRLLVLKLVCFVLLVATNPNAAVSQSLGVDTQEIEPLIREWDFANNIQSVETFRNVYSDTLLFYTQTLPESSAIALKQRLFRQRPGFRQRITSEITYTPFTSGLTKCDFTKEVLEKGKWKAYPSYLLVSYEGNRYQVVGESDYATDRVLRYRLEIGEPIEFETARQEADSAYHSDSFGSEMDTAIASLDSLLEPVDPLVIFPQLSSMGAVTLPKGYVYLLVGLLAIGGLMIFIADSVRSRNHDRPVVHKKSQKKRRFKPGHEMQSAFESFVITLFDPLYFQHSKQKSQAILTGNAPEIQSAPNLEFEFNYKETHARFAIKCQYFKSADIGQIQVFPPGRYQRFKDFENATGMALYFVLGFGGTPDDPKELFLVPASELKSELIRKDAIRRYSKSGMFFYNKVTGRLQ